MVNILRVSSEILGRFWEEANRVSASLSKTRASQSSSSEPSGTMSVVVKPATMPWSSSEEAKRMRWLAALSGLTHAMLPLSYRPA